MCILITISKVRDLLELPGERQVARRAIYLSILPITVGLPGDEFSQYLAINQSEPQVAMQDTSCQVIHNLPDEP